MASVCARPRVLSLSLYRAHMLSPRWLLVGSLALIPLAAHAQKKALTQADWDKWKSIQGAAISSDGNWALYSLVPLAGDGELVVRSTHGSAEYHIPRGYLGRPNNVPGGLRPRATVNTEDDPTGAVTAPGQFTADSRYAVVLTYPAQAEFERAAPDRRAAAVLQTRADLAIVNVADGKVTTVPRVSRSGCPRTERRGWRSCRKTLRRNQIRQRHAGSTALRSYSATSPPAPTNASRTYRPSSSTTAPRYSATPLCLGHQAGMAPTFATSQRERRPLC